MASTRQKNGKWYYRITLSSNGKSKYLERGSFESKKEAEDAGKNHELMLKYGGETAFVPTKITYGDMTDEWLSSYAPTVYKQSTINTHRKVLKNYILPVLKDFEVTAIDTKILQAIINEETPNHTWHGLDKIYASMRRTFDYAVINGYARRNPADGVTMPKIRSIKAQTLKPTREQETCPKQLVNAIFNRFPEGHPCYIPLLLGYRCGLRLGEAYGLFEEDFDRFNRKLYVRRQIQFNERNELYFTDPKYCNPGEYRVIDLDSETCRILTRHIQKIQSCRPVMNHKQYYITPEGLLSETEGEPIFLLNVRPVDGSYISPRTMHHVGRVIHGYEGNFECVDRSWDFHMFRHTHTSECIAAGMPPESVQKRLGHRNLTTTYRYYVHETEDQAERTKAVLEGMYA